MRALPLLLLLLVGCSVGTDSGQMSGNPTTATSVATSTAAAVSGEDDGANGATTKPAATRPPPTGTISGKILFPGAVPSMRICAIHGDGDVHDCVDSEPAAARYRIENLPPTGYVLVAYISASRLRVGGFTRRVPCNREPCPAQLVPVVVAPGDDVTGADLNGFYDSRKDFPAAPTE